jgi:hypothetical protein
LLAALVSTAPAVIVRVGVVNAAPNVTVFPLPFTVTSGTVPPLENVIVSVRLNPAAPEYAPPVPNDTETPPVPVTLIVLLTIIVPV